jgi:hypothetical protein
VEGLLVLALLLLVLAALWFVHHVVSAKWDTLQRSRTQAWISALNGCGQSDVGSIYGVIHERSKNSTEAICEQNCDGRSFEGISNDGQQEPPGWFPAGSGDTASTSHTVNVAPFAALSLSTRRQFSCNERPQPELHIDASGGIEAVAGIAEKIVDESAPVATHPNYHPQTQGGFPRQQGPPGTVATPAPNALTPEVLNPQCLAAGGTPDWSTRPADNVQFHCRFDNPETEPIEGPQPTEPPPGLE